jgi:hypothetical protein
LTPEDIRDPIQSTGAVTDDLMYQEFLTIVGEQLGKAVVPGTLVGVAKEELHEAGRLLVIRGEREWRDFLLLCHINHLERCDFVVRGE